MLKTSLRLPLTAALLALFALPAMSKEYLKPNVDCDGCSANVRAQPTSKSRVVEQLTSESAVDKLEIISKKGDWYHIRLGSDANDTLGYIHKSQVYRVQTYVVDSRDGSANLREAHLENGKLSKKRPSTKDNAVIDVIPNGTELLIRVDYKRGDWLFVDDPAVGFVHKSQVRKEK